MHACMHGSMQVALCARLRVRCAVCGGRHRTREVMVNGQRVLLRYNDTCHFYQPPRAHHCSVNDNCIERFDHHCPWVGTTIGKVRVRPRFPRCMQGPAVRASKQPRPLHWPCLTCHATPCRVCLTAARVVIRGGNGVPLTVAQHAHHLTALRGRTEGYVASVIIMVASPPVPPPPQRNYRTFLLFVYTTTVMCMYVFGVCLATLFAKHKEVADAARAAGNANPDVWGKALGTVRDTQRMGGVGQHMAQLPRRTGGAVAEAPGRPRPLLEDRQDGWGGVRGCLCPISIIMA